MAILQGLIKHELRIITLRAFSILSSALVILRSGRALLRTQDMF